MLDAPFQQWGDSRCRDTLEKSIYFMCSMFIGHCALTLNPQLVLTNPWKAWAKNQRFIQFASHVCTANGTRVWVRYCNAPSRVKAKENYSLFVFFFVFFHHHLIGQTANESHLGRRVLAQAKYCNRHSSHASHTRHTAATAQRNTFVFNFDAQNRPSSFAGPMSARGAM